LPHVPNPVSPGEAPLAPPPHTHTPAFYTDGPLQMYLKPESV